MPKTFTHTIKHLHAASSRPRAHEHKDLSHTHRPTLLHVQTQRHFLLAVLDVTVALMELFMEYRIMGLHYSLPVCLLDALLAANQML